MRRSNLNSLLAVAFSFLFVSCVKPSTGLDTTSGATFIVKSAQGDGYPAPLNEKAVWKIPESVNFKFQACVQERTSRVDLRDQNFVVEVPGSKTIYPVKTDDFGCFSWEEPTPYNHFAGQSGWVQINRDVVGQGVNQGRQPISFAINPWAVGDHARDAEKAVAFMREGSNYFAPTKLFEAPVGDRALAGEMQGTAQLMTYSVDASAIPESEDEHSVALLVTVNLDPYVQSMSASGNTVYEKVRDGTFDVMMQVLGSNVGARSEDKVLLMGGDMRSAGYVKNGHFQAEFRVRQLRRANQGNLELVLKIVPKDLNAYKTLRPLNALVRLGAGTYVKGNNGGTVALECLNGDNCKYEDIVAKTKNYQELVNAGYVQRDERYIFSTLKLRFTSIEPGETTTRRTVVYAASTCITDGQTGRSMANTPMTITYLPLMKEDPANKGRLIRDEDDVEPRVTKWHTDENGCLNWTGKAFHHYYQPEHFYEKEVIISKGEREIERPGVKKPLNIAAFNRHIKFYLNPWDDKFTFGWDSREFTPEFFNEIKNRTKVISRFFLGDYNYHTVRFLYNIDRFMDLEVKKWVLMGITPQVLRYSGIVNARKMVEHLRDGIYLMKVAIQKSYLDPRDNSGWLLHNTPEFKEDLVQIGTKELRPKEYITTNISLVRVVDGLIIYPIDLTMRDLRLMRVRSNFLIQLETVDERLVQAFHVFRRNQIKTEDLEQKLKDFKALVDKDAPQAVLDQQLGDSSETAPDLLRMKNDRDRVITEAKASDMVTARRDLENRVQQVEDQVRDSLEKLKGFYDRGGNLGQSLDSNGVPNGNSVTLKPGQSITENFEMNPDLEKELKAVLQVNDFSTVALPKKEEIDLNLFAEKNSGLEKRSFVGPVIFLSNAYSDSMRSTDNLDEACRPKPGTDALLDSLSFLDKQYDVSRVQMDAETRLFKNRQNNAYLFSQYFNSVSNLCGKNVDDLIKQESEMANKRYNISRAASLAFNYAERFNMDYVSLTDEPLLKVDDACRKMKPDPNSDDPDAKVSVCEGPVDGHLVPTASVPFTRFRPNCPEDDAKCQFEKPMPVLKVSELGELLNAHAYLPWGTWTAHLWDELSESLRGKEAQPIPPQWGPQDYDRLFFNLNKDGRTAKVDEESTEALCLMLSTKISRALLEEKRSGLSEMELMNRIMPVCRRPGALAHDVKYRVDQTGKYTFLGGLNLNFNVGESFSFSTGQGWSGGFDWIDFLSVVSSGSFSIAKSVVKSGVSAETNAAASSAARAGQSLVSEPLSFASDVIGKILKPISLKWGSSMSNSEGTSIGISTYLVSQIAGFDVQLLDYEKCAAVHLSKSFYEYLFKYWDAGPSVDLRDPNVMTIFSRGVFVCQGASRVHNDIVNVPESYFYFTQHFTEGDMLDQAELYNHPWLLALRGMRDFAAFVDKVQLVDVANLGDYLKNQVGMLPPRPKGWALHALSKAYQGVMPAFEGYYSVLNEGEPNLDVFALDQAALYRDEVNGGTGEDLPPHFSKIDEDKLGEVNHQSLKPENDMKIRAPVMPTPPKAAEPDDTGFPSHSNQ